MGRRVTASAERGLAWGQLSAEDLQELKQHAAAIFAAVCDIEADGRAAPPGAGPQLPQPGTPSYIVGTPTQLSGASQTPMHPARRVPSPRPATPATPAQADDRPTDKKQFHFKMETFDFQSEPQKKRRVEESQQRVCSQCGTEDTAEWRAGPEGPATLCNACGLRYRRQEQKKRRSQRKEQQLIGETQTVDDRRRGTVHKRPREGTKAPHLAHQTKVLRISERSSIDEEEEEEEEAEAGRAEEKRGDARPNEEATAAESPGVESHRATTSTTTAVNLQTTAGGEPQGGDNINKEKLGIGFLLN